MTNRYMNAREYYKNKYGERVLKICIDGGFSCPNRDGTKGFGGCIFCSERGSGEKLSPINISAQIKNYFNSYKATRANKFIVYFQNFSNTYAPVDELRAKYESVLIDDRIVGINIGTRPDCINHEIVKLLKELKGVENRNAYFATAVCMVTDNDVKYFHGKTSGRILKKNVGKNGFGYDAIFYSNELKKSFGVASTEAKGKISHRGKAISEFIEYLKR